MIISLDKKTNKIVKAIKMLKKLLSKFKIAILITFLILTTISCNNSKLEAINQNTELSHKTDSNTEINSVISSTQVEVSTTANKVIIEKVPTAATADAVKVKVETKKESVQEIFYTAPKEDEVKAATEKSVENISLYKTNDSRYTITSHLPDGNTLITLFTKKEWGTWNLGSWYASKGDTNIPDENGFLAGGGSDFEYVLRVGDGIGGSYKLSGGNHGSEKLVSIILVDDNNAEIKLKSGGKLELSSFKVLENTELYIDSSFTKKYADVRREYTFSPRKINMDSDFEFSTEVNLATSYVCMFPASKRFGRFARFNDTGLIYTTPESGKTLTTDSFENYYGMDRTLSVDIWGDANPKYVFNVSIGNDDMVDYFKNNLKVFYWDANIGGNKLYFSKYDLEEMTKIEAGTKWHNTASWMLNVKP